MKIAKVWKNDYPWDVRVEKICRTLVDDGHEVHLICSNISKGKTRDVIDGIQIHRLHPIRINILNKICSLPAFFNPFWLYKIFKVVITEKIEAIIVRDLPLALSALLVGKIYKIPVIYDMADNYPALWKNHVNKRGFKFYNHFLKNPILARALENYILKRVDHIIVVVEESKNRILKKSIPENKLSIVSNTPDLNMINKKNQNMKNIFMGKFNLLYVGFVTLGRGLDTVIKSIPILKEEVDNLCFIIVGDGKHLDGLRKMVKKLDIEKYVCFCGWIDFALVPAYIRNSDICVVPHEATEHVNSTIPNKLFDYMACKKPVIVSDAAPLKRIVEENNCGVVFRSRDVKSFVEKVLELQDSSVRYQLSENGYSAVKSKYNWSVDSQELRKVFKRFGGKLS